MTKTKLLLFLSLSACGAEVERSKEPLQIINHANVDETVLSDVVDFVNVITPNGKPVDLTGYVLEVFDSWQQVTDHCAGKEDDGCTWNEPRWYIAVVWADKSSHYEKALSAAILAHELGHVFYEEQKHDEDPNHKHVEWFSEAEEGSVWNQTLNETLNWRL